MSIVRFLLDSIVPSTEGSSKISDYTMEISLRASIQSEMNIGLIVVAKSSCLHLKEDIKSLIRCRHFLPLLPVNTNCQHRPKKIEKHHIKTTATTIAMDRSMRRCNFILTRCYERSRWNEKCLPSLDIAFAIPAKREKNEVISSSKERKRNRNWKSQFYLISKQASEATGGRAE